MEPVAQPKDLTPREGSTGERVGAPKVVVCIATHQRQMQTNLVLQNLPANWHAVVVCTTEADAKAVRRCGHATMCTCAYAHMNTHVYRHPNDPLGAKWQHAIDRARALNPDYVMITGSDDVMLGSTPALEEAMAGHDMLALNGWYIFDGKRHYFAKYLGDHVPIGGGRTYTRALLDKMRWRVFDGLAPKRLDNAGWWHALRHGARVKHADRVPGLYIVSLKGPWKQFNSLNKLRGAAHIDIQPLKQVPFVGHYQF